MARLPSEENQTIEVGESIEADQTFGLKPSLSETQGTSSSDLELDYMDHVELFATVFKADYNAIPMQAFAMMTLSPTLMDNLRGMKEAKISVQFGEPSPFEDGSCVFISEKYKQTEELSGEYEVD